MEFGGFFHINYLFLALGLEGPFLILSGMAAEKLMGSETESVIKFSSSRDLQSPWYIPGEISNSLVLGFISAPEHSVWMRLWVTLDKSVSSLGAMV